MLTVNYWMDHRAPNGGARESPKEQKGSATLLMEQQCELVSLAAYVAEDGQVSHYWEERPLGLANFICPSTRECQGQEVGVSR